jgi:copper resistance protein B
MKLKFISIIPAPLVCLLFVLSLAANVQAQDSPKHWPSAMHEEPLLSKWMLDRLEHRDGKDGGSTYWEAQAWIGGDTDKLWLKTEGNIVHGETDDAELEAYYSRAVSAFWDAQFGVRHDFSSADLPSRNWFGVGFQGLAPYLFEVDATAYIGNNGRTALRFKAEYDLLLTQRWIFMPEVELNAYGKEDTERNIGSGLSDGSLTLRLRYDIRRELSPYLGVMWTQKYGGTANFARAAGADTSETLYLAGLRAWW